MTLDVRLTHRFPGFTLDVAFAGSDGVTALFGRSGSGKTSVVQAVAGLLRPEAGRILLAGAPLLDTARQVEVPVHRRRIGYVFQEGRLFPHLTVRQNLLYGHWFTGGGAATGLARVVDLLGIGALLDRAPADLSGGEKQRVAIGRALLARPRLLLMDEPLAALDEARKAEILPYLDQLARDSAVPILYVSHSLAEVLRLASHVVVLEAGRVLRAGPAAMVLSDPGAAGSLGPAGAGALLEGVVRTHTADGLTEVGIPAGSLLLPHVPAAAGAPVRLRVSAEDVILSRTAPVGLSALNILPAEVLALEPAGPGRVLVQVRLGPDRLLAALTERSALALGLVPGEPCHVVLKSVALAASGDASVWIPAAPDLSPSPGRGGA
ncbi:molybdenum ABC transporter ATP-binding protein [Microvirga tunisiensis]|uniref:Molybdenum ABC transporter ATP-binding protein n=1 Tax=Pannonibacter tanglangensis TaxID=2750084 RepID=A0A7X5F4G5_9HYPH|nr:molybdenum ABC transporter ATP-binding protein [Pannonibacter sp. XCT-53]NBN79593.1 molybdenum ABC transporter ATP-binding protein [Pannonibacter sp. XCT-53]